MGALDIKFGKYTLVDKIGDGGMAEVYRARVSGVGGFEKIVALKKIHPSLSANERFQQNFVNEARICGQLHHHNVVEVYEFDQVGDAFYLAMEFIDGVNLEDLLDVQRRRRDRPLPTKVVVSLMVQMLEGLNYAHNARGLDGKPLNVIHRDLKPSNILIDRTGVVKIVDFGVAKADMNRYVTQEMTAKGTASYMAPEQVLGEKKLSHSVDLFAAGSILWELITSQRLFDGDHVFAILKSVATCDPDQVVARLPAHGTIFGPILRKLLARSPAERAESAGEIIRDLNSLGVAEVGSRTLEKFIGDLEDEIEESEATLIDTSGVSAVTAVADPDRSSLYQTSPTKVAFLPIAQSTTASLVTQRHAVEGFAIPPEEEFEDDSPTRQTTGPTRVSVGAANLRVPERGPRPQERRETTQTNKVDLSRDTERIAQAAPASPPEPGDGWHEDAAPTRAHHGAEPTQPGTPRYVTDAIAAVEPPVDDLPPPSSITLSIPAADESNGMSALVKVGILVAAILVVAMAIFASSPSEHQVNLDFKSNLDADKGGVVSIAVDGRFLCNSPCTELFTFKGDSREIEAEARRDGYESVTLRHRLDASQEGRPPLALQFFLKQKMQSVSVTSDPPGARIFVDDGDTTKLTPATLELPYGTHTFRLEADGRTPRQHVVEVGAGTTSLELEVGESTVPDARAGR